MGLGGQVLRLDADGCVWRYEGFLYLRWRREQCGKAKCGNEGWMCESGKTSGGKLREGGMQT